MFVFRYNTMSTKETWLYGVPEIDGKENDYHLYFDYRDMNVHLEINGKEVDLPPKLREELKEVFSVYHAVVSLVSRAVAHGVLRGEVLAWYSLINLSKSKTAFGRGFRKIPKIVIIEFDEDEESRGDGNG